MIAEIKRILLDKDFSNETKKQVLEQYKESIKQAEEVLDGKWTYCNKCNDYYITKSFFSDQEDVEERVCIYSDPINSGGDEYETHHIRYFYKVCPKGHKTLIDRKDLGKVK